MGVVNEEAVKNLKLLIDEVEVPLQITFQAYLEIVSSEFTSTQNMHQGYPNETLIRFLKAREWNVAKAYKMIVECLNWRVENAVDDILAKPIIPADLYKSVRDSQLIGFSGYTQEGLPIISIGAGLSSFDKASVNYYVQSHIQMNEYRDRIVFPSATKKYGKYIGTCIKVFDMTGLRLSALNHIKLMTVITSIDDLNYPEKTDTYYIVNVPYIFSACWKVVKPLLQERTRQKVQVLQGCGGDELLKIMDHESLPHFCKKQGSGSSKNSLNSEIDNCFSLEHPYHQQLYNYVLQQASQVKPVSLLKQGSVHVKFPESDFKCDEIAMAIKSKMNTSDGKTEMDLSSSLLNFKVADA